MNNRTPPYLLYLAFASFFVMLALRLGGFEIPWSAVFMPLILWGVVILVFFAFLFTTLVIGAIISVFRRD